MLGCVYTGVWGVYVFREFCVLGTCRHCGDVLGCSFMASCDEKWYVVCILMCSGCILCAVIDYKSVTSRDLNVNQFFSNAEKQTFVAFLMCFFCSSSFIPLNSIDVSLLTSSRWH